MKSPIRYVLTIIIAVSLILIGCSGFPTAQEKSPPLPTLDPSLLSITPAPTSTPWPTFTPYPTVERLPSRTPLPTPTPRVTFSPEELATLSLYTTQAAGSEEETPPSGSEAAPAAPAGAQAPPPTPTGIGYVGIQGAGLEAPDLAPILTIASSGATCNEWMLVQVGVINRGTGPAYNFSVEWSLGWGEEIQTEFVEELQWGTTPIFFYNGDIEVPCEETATYTAWIRIDTNDDVTELFEDNNYEEETYTVTFLPDE